MIDPVKSAYLDFDFAGESDSGKTEIWNVLSSSNDFILGQIKWYAPWRQYCFNPSPHTIFNTICMSDIRAMIKKLMDARR